jgi:hypothetical protein
MQTLADNVADSLEPILGATVFFSRPNERDNPKRLFTTVAYQLSVKYPPYRKYVKEILDHDPKILGKSMAEQFKWFIAKPFAARNVLQGLYKTVLIILDGLDECKGVEAQRELVLLIGRFALTHRNTPLIWAIASRPEPHIRAVFSNSQIRNCHWEVDVPVDSDQGCADVERFLRDKFLEIREKYSFFFDSKIERWPAEAEFLKIANTASGLFIFAAVVIRFVMDENYGNPISQLQRVLGVIDSTPSTELQSNPLATLDNLYAEILAGIPLEILPTTKTLLSFLFVTYPMVNTFGFGCNLFKLRQADAYGALWKLHSVLAIPSPEKMTERTLLKVFHASFSDYIRSPARAGHFYVEDPQPEVDRRLIQILLETHNPCWSSLLLKFQLPDHWYAADATIESSRIEVSWAYQDKAKVQRHLLRWTLGLVINTGYRAAFHQDNPRETELAAFFGDMDYGYSSAVCVPRTQFCTHLCGHNVSGRPNY